MDHNIVLMMLAPFRGSHHWPSNLGSATIGTVIREAVAVHPSGPLGTVVGEHHGYRERGVAPMRHLGLPSPWLTVIFTLHEPLHIAQHVDPSQQPGSFDALVGGLHTSPAVVVHDGAQSGIQLALSPLGARALLGMPAGELASIDLHAVDVLGPLARELHERLVAAPDWPSRFALLDDCLGRRLDEVPGPPREVCHAWRMLRSSRGTVPIGAIAREVGWSERHLAARFRTEIGLAPKAAARVIRFDRARRMIRTAPGADVAARCGYFDQSHLVRDFVAFTGLSPTAWVATEVGNIQVPQPAERAGLAS
jgi:AraC-like DNA-binding protein